MISAYVQLGNHNKALKLLIRMRWKNFRGDQVTFASVMKAAASLALISLGKQLHSCIIRAGFITNVYCGSALLDMYAKCGSLKDAIAVFQDMPDRNTITWNSLISAYAQSGDGGVGSSSHPVSFLSALTACSHSGSVDEALEYFSFVKNTYKLVPRKEHYASLIDVLCGRGRFKEAETLMAQMFLPVLHTHDITLDGLFSARSR